MEIIYNDFFSMNTHEGDIFINTFKKGFPIRKFNELLREHPRILITEFTALKNALEKGEQNILVGKTKNIIECLISKDEMKADVKINCTVEELERDYDKYMNEIKEALKETAVIYGIKEEVLHSNLIAGKFFTIAEGVPPTDGNHAELIYIERSERKPTIREDGQANYYDMNFLVEVKKGEWIGERIPPQPGTPGKTVTGDSIQAKSGKDRSLSYDKISVTVSDEKDKTVLRAKREGIVEFTSGKISIGDHLVIDGDVGVETGNIEFEGNITIKGIIQSRFSVKASKDIYIQGEMGVSSCDNITSLYGSIFIKGGIFGHQETSIDAGKNVYVKHANECRIYADGDVHIGTYAKGCEIKSNNIFLDKRRGQLIGGVAEAHGMITVAVVGNRMERRTQLKVSGFDSIQLEYEVKNILSRYKQYLIEIERKRKVLSTLHSSLLELNDRQRIQLEHLEESLEMDLKELAEIDEKRLAMINWLDTKSEGLIEITKRTFSNVELEMKNSVKHLHEGMIGKYYLWNGQMNYE
ncbi:DUF342 domain-containing protein [Bacillus sp. 2205SS5-2]|uniref:DUF342 domain-containing protein n=1 Tax=Bacillus sp. 2205SS5-2 TaxID=3109031 RepID=UPI0030076DFC